MSSSRLPSSPLTTLLLHHKKSIVTVVLVDLMVAVGFFLTVTFVVNYLRQFTGMADQDAFWINLCAMGAFAAVIPMVGLLSDHLGVRFCLVVSALGFLILSYPLFLALTSGSFHWALAGHMTMGVLMGFYFAPISAVLMTSFPREVRYSGISLAHNISMTIFGGSAPWLVTWLIKYTGNVLAPSYYLMWAAAGSLVGIAMLKGQEPQ